MISIESNSNIRARNSFDKREKAQQSPSSPLVQQVARSGWKQFAASGRRLLFARSNCAQRLLLSSKQTHAEARKGQRDGESFTYFPLEAFRNKNDKHRDLIILFIIVLILIAAAAVAPPAFAATSFACCRCLSAAMDAIPGARCSLSNGCSMEKQERQSMGLAG